MRSIQSAAEALPSRKMWSFAKSQDLTTIGAYVRAQLHMSF